MTINFPGSLDNFTNPTSASPINSPSHADQHANANDAIEALEAKVGVDGSSVVTSHDYKIAQLQSLVTSAVAGAKSIYQDVRNQSGSAFTKATPVYVSGSTGTSGQLLVSAASNATEATSSKTMGITTSAISNNSNGQVISEGILEGIDTTGAADGDPVWLGVDGAKIYGLANKPSAPAHLVFLGIVIRGGQANTGSMYVKIQNGFELQEIHNVEISSLINGNILAYDSTTQTWKNTNTLQSTSSTVPLVIKGATSQSANLQEWQNSAGTVLSAVNALGQGVFTNTTPITASAVSQAITAVSFTSTTATYTFSATAQTISVGEYVTVFGITPSGYNGTYQVTAVATVSAGTSYSFTVENSTNATVTVGTGYFFPSASVSISTQNKAHTGLIIKAVSGQTASTMEIQNSLGQPVTWWDSTGGMTASQAVVSTLYSGGFMNTGMLGYFNATTFNPAVRPIVVRGAASQTANLQEWQNSAGQARVYVDGYGSFYSKTYAAFGNDFNVPGTSLLVYTKDAAGIPIIVKGWTSQTANLQEWQDVNGTVLSKIKSTGAIEISASDSTRALYVNNSNASGYGMIVNASGGRVFQAQVNGTTKFFVDGTGLFRIGSTASAPAGVFHIDMASAGNGSASNLGLTIRSNTSLTQTGDLFQIQDTSASAITHINNIGRMTINSSADAGGAALYVFQPNGGYGVRVQGTGTTGAAIWVDSVVGGVGQIIRGASSQTANLQEWQTSAGIAKTYIKNIGGADNELFGWLNTDVLSGTYICATGSTSAAIAINSSTSVSFSAAIVAGSASTVGLIIKGVASQTADLQQWQDSSGTVIASVSSSGSVISNGSFLTGGTLRATSGLITGGITAIAGTRASIYTNNATTVGLIIQGAASQTANLQEWQDSNGNTQAFVRYDGFINTNNSVRIAGDNLSVYRFQGVSDGNYTMNFPGSGNIQLFSATNDTGSGVGVLGIKNATTAPTSNPTTGGILYVSSGALLYRGTSNSSQQIIGADGSVKFTSPAASIVPLIIQHASSPSSSYFEIRNSAGNPIWGVNSSGEALTRTTTKYGANIQNDSSNNYNALYIQGDGSGNGIPLYVKLWSGTKDIVKFDNGGVVKLSITSDGSLKGGNSNTISVNTASTVDTVALSSFTSMEYTLSIKQGSKIRSSKVLVHTDGTSVDSTEYGIMEMGGGISGILVTASVSSTNAILQVTITDAATTNATVKLIKTML